MVPLPSFLSLSPIQWYSLHTVEILGFGKDITIFFDTCFSDNWKWNKYYSHNYGHVALDGDYNSGMFKNWINEQKWQKVQTLINKFSV